MEVVSEEAIESHMKSTPAESLPHPSAGDKKPKVMKPFAANVKGPSSKVDSTPSATIRAWAGAGLIGLLFAWTMTGATRRLP